LKHPIKRGTSGPHKPKLGRALAGNKFAEANTGSIGEIGHLFKFFMHIHLTVNDGELSQFRKPLRINNLHFVPTF
jgi:hypothetical protein